MAVPQIKGNWRWIPIRAIYRIPKNEIVAEATEAVAAATEAVAAV